MPEIARLYFFEATRIERYLVGCYARGWRPLRGASRQHDQGTAHRRFAVSINLNDDFEGGEVSFPEYGPHWLQAARRRGRGLLLLADARGLARIAWPALRLPAVPLRRCRGEDPAANNQFLDPSVGTYKGG